MLVLLLLACAPNPAGLANCTVTAVSSTPEGDGHDDFEEVTVYDFQGRVARERRVYFDGTTARGDYRYDGDCLVEQRARSEWSDGFRTQESRSTCDEHGHVERLDVESWLAEDGAEGGRSGVVEYDNVHDAEGRLVEVSPGERGTDTTAYEWAAPCEEPFVKRMPVADGQEYRETLVCRADGQPSERELTLTDAAGRRLGALRTLYAYDLAGRLVAEERDEGPASDITYRTTWAYDDPAAPGPTEEIGTYLGEVFRTVGYTYACDP